MLQFPHIRKEPGNALGQDFIGTDPHGCLAVLREVTEPLTPHDRLFLCGDLIDRDITNSYALLKHLESEIASGKKIFIIRGNHEDMVLRTLDFLEVMDAMYARIEFAPDDAWKDFIVDHPYGLEGLSIRNCTDIIDVYQAFCDDFCNQSNGNGQLTRRDIREYRLAMENLFQSKSSMSEAFYHFASHVFDGGAWTLALEPEQRDWVKSFIEPLPYMIRVGAVEQEGCLIAGFDIVHAAPLSDDEIEEALQKMHGPMLTSAQIAYMTWARPPETRKRSDILMDTRGRTLGSSRVYVGHNILSAHYPIYRLMNVFVLDASTFCTGIMFVVKHKEHRIVKFRRVGLSPPMLLANQAHQEQAFSALKTLLAEKEPSSETKLGSTCVHDSVTGMDKTFAFYPGGPRSNDEAIEKRFEGCSL